MDFDAIGAFIVLPRIQNQVGKVIEGCPALDSDSFLMRQGGIEYPEFTGGFDVLPWADSHI